MDFAAEELHSWDDLAPFSLKNWLYRGQRRATWPLETALERCCDRRSIAKDRRRDVEDALSREFRRAYHQYGAYVPVKASVLEWLALMQHHGAPTRLLDFTYSIYVAAYFALEESDDHCAVWGVNGPWALTESIKLLHDAGKADAPHLRDRYDEGDDHVFGKLFFSEPIPKCACPQNPFRLNERLRIQMGVFMVPGRVDVSFEDNLRALPGHDRREHVVKIVIPPEVRRDALPKLFDMGISRRSLFPGLDGYAQSLAVYTPAFNPIEWDGPAGKP